MINKRLKSCPFCGGKATYVAAGGDRWIACTKCKVAGATGRTEVEAITLWNQRAPMKSKTNKPKERYEN